MDSIDFGAPMRKVGNFLFHWSLLEQQLSSAIGDANRQLGQADCSVRGSLSERLLLWYELISQMPDNESRLPIAQEVRAQALALRDVRNLIVHGFQASSAMSESSPAHIRCATGGYEIPHSDIVSITLRDLDHFTECIDACRRAFINLNGFNYRLHLSLLPTLKAGAD